MSLAQQAHTQRLDEGIAVQHKVSDIAPPLVDLYACALTLEMEDNVEAAKDSGSVHAFYCIFLLLSRFVLPKEIFLPYTGRFYLAHSHHPFAQAHYRSMQRFYIDQALRVDFDLATKCILSSEATADLVGRKFVVANGKAVFS